MKNNEIQNILNQKHRGAYLTIIYRSEHNGYAKTTKTTIRLVNVKNTKAYIERYGEPKQLEEKPSKPSNDIYLGNNLIYNQKTGKTRLQAILTQNKRHHPHSSFERLETGDLVSAEEYYEQSGAKHHNVDLMFSVLVENIVAIG